MGPIFHVLGCIATFDVLNRTNVAFYLELLTRMYLFTTKSLISGPSYGPSRVPSTSRSPPLSPAPSKMPSSNNLRKQPSRSLSKQDELLSIQTQYFVKLEDLKLTRKQKCLRFVYDTDTKKVMGRTPTSWCE
ncbi:hypothetical protein Zmor_016016 [Zophobas morio]|uniref:Uncharacterized protein n=1 Tax=Zophobas morio TaxID=2755281 RepID=A0AA38MI32_9CUCU|nr:hypothetical protein Zmor_016016 [Zophobas morio]